MDLTTYRDELLTMVLNLTDPSAGPPLADLSGGRCLRDLAQLAKMEGFLAYLGRRDACEQWTDRDDGTSACPMEQHWRSQVRPGHP